MRRLENKVCLITGGGRGIGRAIAERFAEEGAALALAGRDTKRLVAAARDVGRHGAKVTTHALDVREEASIDAVVDEVVRAHGALHVLVNNSGISGPTPLDSVTWERWRDILATNLDGAYFMCRAAARALPDHAGGRIINVSSIGAQIPFPGWTAYCASKAGLVGVTKCLAMELAPRGITVNAILPGWVKSDMQEAGVEFIARAMGRSVDEALPEILAQVPLRRMSDAEEVAAVAAHLASEDGRGMTGSSTVVSNGAYMN